MFSCPLCKSNYLSSSSSSVHSRHSHTTGRPQARRLPNPRKQPLVLRCGHTVCESCINKLKEKFCKPQTGESARCVDLDLDYKFKLPCPHSKCGVITLLRNGLEDLPVNMYISSYVENDGNAERRKICDGIIAGASGDCHVHVVNKLQDGQKIEGSKSRQDCAVHHRIIEYYCETDNSLICSRCYIMGDHKDHSIQSLEDKNKLVLGDIETGMITAKTVLSQLNALDKKSSAAISELKTDMMSIIQSINQSFMSTHTLLQARESEMIDRVSIAFKNIIFSFLDEKGESLNAKKDLKILLEEATNLCDNTGFIIDGNSVVERLKLASHIPCILPKHNDHSNVQGDLLQWQEKNLEKLTAAIKSFGDINGTMNVMKLKTLDEAGDEIEEDDRLSVVSESSSYPVSDLQSLSSQISQTSADVIIESDSETGSEVSAPSCSATTKCNVREKNVNKFKEKIVMPTVNGAPQQVVVTHINSPCNFFVQLNANKTKFETLAHNMNLWCRKQSSTKHIPKTVDRGKLVLARFGFDKLWYRAQVLDIIEPEAEGSREKKLKVKVKYVDFGNEEVVHLKDLRIMQERFLMYPEFSIHCCMHGIAPFEKNKSWEFKDTEKFLSMTNSKVLLLNALSVTGNVYFIDLICTPNENVTGDGFVSVRDMLVFLEHARFCADSVESAPKLPVLSSSNRTFYKPTALKSGATVNVSVTEITSPSSIYIIPMGEEIIYYLRMQEEMQETYTKDTSNLYLLHWPRKDMLCAVEQNECEWYRGCVVNVATHQKVTVFLTDIGSTVVVSCDKLRKLLNDFIKLPSQAVRCTLKDICLKEDEGPDWSQETKEWCQTKIKESNGSARIVRWGDPAEIVLWLEEKDGHLASLTINYQLVKLGFAQSSGISSVPSHSLPQSTEAKGKSPNKMLSMSPKPAHSPSGKKLSPSPSNKMSPSARNATSPQSGSPNKKKSPKYSKARRQISAEFENGQDARTAVKSKGLPGKGTGDESKSQKSNDSSDGDRAPNSAFVEIIICSYQSPGHFYIRMQENEVMLNDLMDDLQETYRDTSPEKEEEWVVDAYCVVRNTEDGKWYRGKIKTVQPSSDVEVELLDYGHEMKVSLDNLRVLHNELGLRLHCAAVRCHLAGLIAAGSSDSSKWTKTAVEFMADQVKDKKLFLKTEGEPTDEGLPVDIVIEEEIPPTAFEPTQHFHHSLRKIIQEQGLAMESKVKRSNSTTGTSVGDMLERKIYQKESPIPEALLICQEEETSKDSGNVSSSPQALKEMQSPVCAVECVESTESLEDQDDTLVENGNALNREDEDETVVSFNIPSFPMPFVGEELEVLPTYVDHYCVIFAQPLIWESAIIHITEELQRLYEDSEETLITWKPGDSCVAKFQDDNLWYRGLLRDVENGKALVFFVDFGNMSWISQASLRPITKEAASQHVLTYSCVVDNIMPNSEDGLWQVPILSAIHGMVVNCQCTIVVTEVDEVAAVIKVKVQKSDQEGWDLSTVLVEKGYAISNADLSFQCELSTKIRDVLSEDNCYFQRNPGSTGDEFKAVVTNVELPNLIYMQKLRQSEEDCHDFVLLTDIAELNKGIDEFEEMMDHINSTTSQSCVELPLVGLMCLGQFAFDSRWYRAICIEQHPDEDACLLVYIDYGNLEIVSRDRMRLMPSKYLDMPALSFRCYINLIPPAGPDSFWHKGSLDAMMEALSNKELVVKITQKSPLTVELRLAEESGEAKLAYQGVVERGLALLPDQLKDGPTDVNSKVSNGDVEVEEEDEEEEREAEEINKDILVEAE